MGVPSGERAFEGPPPLCPPSADRKTSDQTRPNILSHQAAAPQPVRGRMSQVIR